MQIIDVEKLKKVLEFEPLNSIKTDGLIDRKTVIDFLSGTTNLDPKAKGSLVMYIMSLPDMQPERKTGNWVGIDDDPCDVYECDQCGAIYDTADNTWDLPDYCPSCGADMRKENES